MPDGTHPHAAQAPNRKPTSTVDDRVRFASALAHTIPGVVLRVSFAHGDHITVGYAHTQAHLTPCQLRCAVLGYAPAGTSRLIEAITDIDVVAGLDHLGGGLYGRGSGAAGDERWFATALNHEQILPLFATTPFGLADDACAVRLSPDTELGVTVVKLVAAPHAGVHVDAIHPDPIHLDEVAFWALSTCMVAELGESIASSPPR